MGNQNTDIDIDIEHVAGILAGAVNRLAEAYAPLLKSRANNCGLMQHIAAAAEYQFDIMTELGCRPEAFRNLSPLAIKVFVGGD